MSPPDAARRTFLIDRPIVSVIIPTHDRVDLLPRAVDSVRRQTFADFECIIVDDASSDATPALGARLAEADPRVRYVRHEEIRHAAGARNTGMRLARGEYIAFLDDDDEWLPAKLEKQVALLRWLSPEYAGVYCWADYIDPEGRVVRRYRPALIGDAFADTLFRNAIGCTCSLMIRREAAALVGCWNESLRIEEDDEYMIRLCRAGKVHFVPEVLVRVHVDYRRPRVSSPTSPEGLEHARLAVEARYALFFSERHKYRRQAAALEALIGALFWRQGERAQGMRHFMRAAGLDFASLPGWRLFLGTAAWQLFRRSRASGSGNKRTP